MKQFKQNEVTRIFVDVGEHKSDTQQLYERFGVAVAA